MVATTSVSVYTLTGGLASLMTSKSVFIATRFMLPSLYTSSDSPYTTVGDRSNSVPCTCEFITLLASGYNYAVADALIPMHSDSFCTLAG